MPASADGSHSIAQRVIGTSIDMQRYYSKHACMVSLGHKDRHFKHTCISRIHTNASMTFSASAMHVEALSNNDHRGPPKLYFLGDLGLSALKQQRQSSRDELSLLPDNQCHYWPYQIEISVIFRV